MRSSKVTIMETTTQAKHETETPSRASGWEWFPATDEVDRRMKGQKIWDQINMHTLERAEKKKEQKFFNGESIQICTDGLRGFGAKEKTKGSFTPTH